MSNSYTFTKEESYALLAEGEYEVRIEKIEEQVSKNGKKNISIMFRVRDDIEQEGKNRVIFESIWKEKDTEFYNRKRLNQIIGTQHFEDGTVFKDINDVLSHLKNVVLIAVIKQVFDDYRQEDINVISYYKTSQHLPKALDTAPVKNNTEKIVAEEDLPF